MAGNGSNGSKANNMEAFEEAWKQVQSLVEKFKSGQSHYLSSAYQEAEVRKDFIDKLFKALGWDVDHENQHDPYRQEVKIEKGDQKTKGRADYAFALAPFYRRTRFLVEAKRPQIDIAIPDNCFQVVRYSWPKGLPVSVLTDFHTLHVIDSRFRPNIKSITSRIAKSWHYTDYLDRYKFSELYWLLSREAVSNESLTNYAENQLPPPEVASKQYALFAGETREFDDDFLQKLDEWRKALANSFKKSRASLDGEQLTECVQRTLDRLVFIRFLEDKLIEPEHIIERYGSGKTTHWHDFVISCKRLDQIYNGIVFKHHAVLDDKSFEPDGTTFSDICDEISDQHSPYNFDSIPIEILGRIYERFLGKVVLAHKKTVEVIDKPDVRKAGGVYYTPDYIVAYMVENSLGAHILDKKPDEILKLRIIDTACGSGSFLIGAFTFILQSLLVYFSKHPHSAKKGILSSYNGENRLSLKYKREILINCIYGVDIDPQAVEVAQLSLYLKLLEDETTFSANQQLEMGAALLPSLSTNIVCGNSLVSPTDQIDDLFSADVLHHVKPLNFEKTFKHVFTNGGFDLVIGNPPYIKEYTNRDAFNHVRDSKYYQGKMDIWYLFACKAIDLLRPGSGMLAFIATNNWTTNFGAKKLRNYIASDALIIQFIDFNNFMVFRDASIQTMILIARRDASFTTYKFEYRRLDLEEPTLQDAMAFLHGESRPAFTSLNPKIIRAQPYDKALVFADPGIDAVLSRLQAVPHTTIEDSEITQGIVTPQGCVIKAHIDQLGSGFSVGQGIFVINDNEKSQLALSPDELELIKPYFTTEELGRYWGNDSNKHWVIYTSSKFKQPAAIKGYPNIKSHLDQFRKVITSHNKPYGLHRSRSQDFFEGEKIISLRKCERPTFTYTGYPCYVSQTFNVIKTTRFDLKYLTAVLNSQIVSFWLRYRGKMQGSMYQVDTEPLLAVPICNANTAQQHAIATLVDTLLALYKQLSSESVDHIRERLIRYIDETEAGIQDEITKLYQLSEADINYIRKVVS